jgi:hypothetical protein
MRWNWDKTDYMLGGILALAGIGGYSFLLWRLPTHGLTFIAGVIVVLMPPIVVSVRKMFREH